MLGLPAVAHIAVFSFIRRHYFSFLDENREKKELGSIVADRVSPLTKHIFLALRKEALEADHISLLRQTKLRKSKSTKTAQTWCYGLPCPSDRLDNWLHQIYQWHESTSDNRCKISNGSNRRFASLLYSSSPLKCDAIITLYAKTSIALRHWSASG